MTCALWPERHCRQALKTRKPPSGYAVPGFDPETRKPPSGYAVPGFDPETRQALPGYQVPGIMD